MKQLAMLTVFAFLLSTLSSCIVRTGPRRHHHSRARSCPPSYHWNGAACVHNSNRGRGHGKVRDHRRR